MILLAEKYEESWKNRLELQQRQRDIAEKNIDVEIAQLKKEVEVGGLL